MAPFRLRIVILNITPLAGGPHLHVLRADVDLAPAPVCALVDQHPRLLPLQFVAQSDGHNLTNKINYS